MSIAYRLTIGSFACSMLSFLSISQAASSSYTGRAYREGPRDLREIRYEMQYGAFRHCLPATGAQILGGFASPHDWLDPDTDEICNR